MTLYENYKKMGKEEMIEFYKIHTKLDKPTGTDILNSYSDKEKEKYISQLDSNLFQNLDYSYDIYQDERAAFLNKLRSLPNSNVSTTIYYVISIAIFSLIMFVSNQFWLLVVVLGLVFLLVRRIIKINDKKLFFELEKQYNYINKDLYKMVCSNGYAINNALCDLLYGKEVMK